MKTLIEQRSSHSGPTNWVFAALFLMTVSPSLTMADDVDEALQQAEQRFQFNALFNPSDSELRAEERGRVMIYSGLDEAMVEKALDDQFERIEHMMFVNTKRKEPADQVSSYEDDC
ncbi:MAG: hypothetical protein PVG38_13085 [Gammaproteobacteria bacterium]|jgi:hypothetical protein